MNSVGTTLRTERERQQREVAEIAEELCITQRYLRAIEQDDLKSLPGTFFYKSFVKQYAAILGIDEASLQPGIDSLTAATEPLPLPGTDARYPARERSSEPKPIRAPDPIVQAGNRSYFGDSRIGQSVAGLAAVLLLCSGVYAWYNKAPQPQPVAKVEPASTVIAPVKAEPPAPPQQPQGQPQEQPQQQPKIDVTTTTDSDGVNHVLLSLSATEKTWLSISADGKQIFSGVLEPSQTKTLNGVEFAKMKVGNAGGLDIRWNGKSIGPIGPRGQVRVLKFTKQNFEILQPSEAM